MPYDRNDEATNTLIKALAKNVQAAHGGGSGSEMCKLLMKAVQGRKNIHKDYDM
jgi:hypothetical protein